MGRIVFDTATSLNGMAWLFVVEHGERPDEGDRDHDGPPPALMPTGVTVMVEGSTTYEWVLAEEDILANPKKWHDFHGDRPTFVFTTRDLPVPEGADIRFVSGPVADALPAIRAAAGDGTIWVVGGGDLAGQFLDIGALDEIAVSVAPVALTGGAPLLPRRLEADRLRLMSATAVGQFARLVYALQPAEPHSARTPASSPDPSG